MKLIWQYMKEFKKQIIWTMFLKFLATLGELSLPYILEHIIDYVVPLGRMRPVVYWGLFMVVMSFFTWYFNVTANRGAVKVSKETIYNLRSDVFKKIIHLSGTHFDSYGLPSLTSRMTSDTYNIQDFMTRIQTLGIRGPIMMAGGIIMTLTMDVPLAMVLILMVPVILCVVLAISWKGTPLYAIVQQALDNVVLRMRENITGIRVVKALSREEYETGRFQKVNEDYTHKDLHANNLMALPGPFMDLCLNVGLTLVVLLGAFRVNAGKTEPGVILAFLTYFNLILMACRSLNRIFVMYSKASSSAERIGEILADEDDQPVVNTEDTSKNCIDFNHVSFSYSGDVIHKPNIKDIDFHMKKGETLGIIGATGSGKSTIVNLLMRFYDVQEGQILVDGKNIRSYDKDELRRKFGRVFQNDFIENATIEENIDFGRNIPEEDIKKAADTSMASEFIDRLEGGYQYTAAIAGANLSGGQKQRILVARSLADHPEVLILDDSSSALDYKTDARLRQNIKNAYPGTTIIMIAQRISSVMSMDRIIVMENGRMEAFGSHQQLLETCEDYKNLYESQMGELA